MIIINDCSLKPNPANINSAVSAKVGVTGFPDVLSQASWAQIAQASELGVASSLWSVGDEKTIHLAPEGGGLPEKPDDYNTLTLVIMGFNHDDKADGSGKAGITFGMKNLMASTRQMNSSNTNRGGFTGSAMYTWLTGTLLPALPSDLQAVLKSVNKKTSAGSHSSTINTNAMKVFLFSEIEIFGSVTDSKSGEGSQYDYFATAANRRKYLSNGSGSAKAWWERSPIGTASYSRGVCFGFCV